MARRRKARSDRPRGVKFPAKTRKIWIAKYAEWFHSGLIHGGEYAADLAEAVAGLPQEVSEAIERDARKFATRIATYYINNARFSPPMTEGEAGTLIKESIKVAAKEYA